MTKAVVKFKPPFSGQAWTQSIRDAANTLKALPQGFTQWFTPDDAKIADILAQIRASLPTTEVILIGKPQSGKSSIIRSLTGATADIIGKGFRPHTQHTQRYLYPTEDLPLMVFTDTVGIGDGQAALETVTQEIMSLLAPPAPRSDASSPPDLGQRCAKIIILTVKASDFANGYLLDLMAAIRKSYPEIPALLAVTCLHELYPDELENHPPYPPQVKDLEKAWDYLKQQFAPQTDQAVLLDFTLESDGYTPVFYGVEAFVEAIAELLPEAESRMIHQLLDQAEAGNAIESIYRQAGRRYILPFSIMAATLAAVPLPLATMPVLTTLQITLVGLLGRLYGQSINLSQAGGVVSAIAGGFMAQAIGRELVKFVPVVGSVVAASWAGAYTWALGEGACVYFGDLMGGHKPDPKKIQTTMQEAFKAAQQRFRDSVDPS